MPEDGELIFLEFYNFCGNNSVLTKNIDFRTSIYYALDRVKIVSEINDPCLKPTSVLFTKDFLTQNQTYLPDQTFYIFKESEKVYESENITNYGFNFDKALELLKKSWTTLTPEQKKKITK